METRTLNERVSDHKAAGARARGGGGRRREPGGGRRGAGRERGAPRGALSAWRPGRGRGEPRAGTCSSRGRRAGVGARVRVGAWGVCPRRAPRACCRAGAGVSHGGARLYNGPETRASRPPVRPPAAPRSSERSPAPRPQRPPTAAQSRGRHEGPALRPAAAPAAAAAAAAHAPRRGRRRHHRGKRPRAHLSAGDARPRCAPGTREGSGSGRVTPGGDICPSRPLALWERCRAPKAADGPGPWARRGRKSDRSVTISLITTFSPLLPF